MLLWIKFQKLENKRLNKSWFVNKNNGKKKKKESLSMMSQWVYSYQRAILFVIVWWIYAYLEIEEKNNVQWFCFNRFNQYNEIIDGLVWYGNMEIISKSRRMLCEGLITKR